MTPTQACINEFDKLLSHYKKLQIDFDGIEKTFQKDRDDEKRTDELSRLLKAFSGTQLELFEHIESNFFGEINKQDEKIFSFIDSLQPLKDKAEKTLAGECLKELLSQNFLEENIKNAIEAGMQAADDLSVAKKLHKIYIAINEQYVLKKQDISGFLDEKTEGQQFSVRGGEGKKGSR